MSAVYGATAVSPKPETRTGNWQPDKTTFLRLLAAQLQYQNPMEPIKNEDFVTQLVQFTILERLQEMSDQLSRIWQMESLLRGSALLGKRVTVDRGDGETVEGSVERVSLGRDGVTLWVNGESYSLERVREVWPSG